METPLTPQRDGVSPHDTSSVFLSESTEQISGFVERVLYFNDETGQCVLDVRIDSSKERVMVGGRVASVFPGQRVQVELNAPSNNQKVRQASSIELNFPESERSLKKFLKSEAIPEFSSHIASILSKSFPSDLFLVLENFPQRLKEVHGIGEKRYLQILESWSEFKSKQQLQHFLFSKGLPLHWGKTLWMSHQQNALEFFKAYPYDSVKKHQFAFDLVDIYALKEGTPRESTERIRSGIWDRLHNHYNEGHCAYPEKKLLAEISETLLVSEELAEEALELEVLEGNIICEEIAETPCLYLKEIWHLERHVAKKLLEFQKKSPPWGWINMNRALGWAQKLLNIQLAPLQKEAIETALNSSLTVITGGPGTGKTTLIRSLVTILQTQSSRFALCSPTGRAAHRLEEATAAPAQTLHRLLKYDSLSGGFGYNPENPLHLDLVLVDEVSMVDLSLMSHLLNALPPQCALVLVGDVDQIPSVGAGNVLQSIIDSKKFNTVRLTDTFRHHEQSSIRVNAEKINTGMMPQIADEKSSDFHFIPAMGPQEIKRIISELVTDVIPNKYGISDPRQLQILVPMNRGELGTQQLNEELKEHFVLNGVKNLKRINGFSQNFKTGDKVMVIKNDYKKGVFNGDIGFIEDIDPESEFLDILFEDREVRYGFEELDRLALAYAISIHKSQGSEYRAVIVVLGQEHLPIAQRHLIYTAVTRGKEQVFLVAEPSALQAAVLSDENNRRWQKLTELLQSAPRFNSRLVS